MKLGVHENYQGPTARSVSQTLAAFPLAEVTREFEAGVLEPQSLVTRVERRCSEAWSAGKTVVWSFKPSVPAVLNGAWKPYVEALGRYLAAAGRAEKTVVVIWHEPENDMGAEQFVAMFNAVHDWLKASSGGAVQTSHAALVWRYRNWTVEQAAHWTTRADIHSVDIYSGRSFPLDMTLGTSVAFQVWKASRPAGSRWGVSERGWIADRTNGLARVAAIDAEAEYLRSLTPAEQPDFYIVWNTVGVENDPKIVLDRNGVAAVNDLFGDLTRVECPVCHGSGTVPPGVIAPVPTPAEPAAEIPGQLSLFDPPVTP